MVNLYFWEFSNQTLEVYASEDKRIQKDDFYFSPSKVSQDPEMLRLP